MKTHFPHEKIARTLRASALCQQVTTPTDDDIHRLSIHTVLIFLCTHRHLALDNPCMPL